MLFDTVIDRKNITYKNTDPKAINYLEEVQSINEKYMKKFASLCENLELVRKQTAQDKKLNLYREAVLSFINDISITYGELSEEVNNLYDKFVEGYSTLNESEQNIFNNLNYIMETTMFFNGHLYNLEENTINFSDNIYNIDNEYDIFSESFKYYNNEIANSKEYYNSLRGKMLGLNESLTKEEFYSRAQNLLMANNGERYNARLTRTEKDNILESLLNNEDIVVKCNRILNNINKKYCEAMDYFEGTLYEDAKKCDYKFNDLAMHSLLAQDKLKESMNVLSTYNECMAIVLDTYNKQNKEYTKFFTNIL